MTQDDKKCLLIRNKCQLTAINARSHKTLCSNLAITVGICCEYVLYGMQKIQDIFGREKIYKIA